MVMTSSAVRRIRPLISARRRTTGFPIAPVFIFATVPCLVVKVRSGSPQFETALRKERQLEGIAKAKAEGVYKGRKPSVDVAQVPALKAQGIGPAAMPRRWASAGRRSTGHWRADARRVRAPPLLQGTVGPFKHLIWVGCSVYFVVQRVVTAPISLTG